MRIFVKVRTFAKTNRVEKLSEDAYRVYTSAKPVDGEANKAVTSLLSKYFKTAKSNIEVIAGQKSGDKIVIIN